MKRCFVFGGGTVSDDGFIRAQIRPDDLIFCADSGLTRCVAAALHPDLIVGDFDSYRGELPAGIPVIHTVPEKDDTDMLLAVKVALERDCKEIFLCGALGGRLDHTLANLSLLAFIGEHGGCGVLLDRDNTAFLVQNEKTLVPRTDGYYLSVFSFGEQARGVSLRGVKYPLARVVLQSSYPLGVSNEITGPQAEIEVEHGRLLVLLSRRDQQIR